MLIPAPPPESRTDPLLGSHVSEYVIQERIGAGGMGIVYRAVQPLIGKQVAIKILKADITVARELVQRLLVEARVVNAIQHRGVIDIFGFGQLPDGRPYVVMELLQGVSLSTFIRKRKRLPAEEAVAILDEMLAALGAAHRGGVIHRDLKPGNVFLVENSEGERSVKLLDFGIAKVAEFRPSRPLTMEGHILGTPEYMAPEQVRGEKVGPTSDLYAMGVIAFQMLTGRLPFLGEQTRVLVAQMEEKPPALSSLVPDVPKVLETIVMRLLAKAPASRYASAEVVRRELSTLLPPRVSGLAVATGETRGSANEPPTLSLRSDGRRTIEVPMLADSAQETEPLTADFSPPVAHVSRPAKPRWLVAAVGATALAASAGVVGFKVLHRSPSAIVSSPAPQVPTPPAPQPSEPSSPPAQPVALAASAPEEGSKRQRVEVSRPQLEAAPQAKPSPGTPPARKAIARPTPPKSGSPTRAASATPGLDQPTLMVRLLDAEGRLLKINPTACPVTSPAMARLRELQAQAREAGTNEARLKVVGLLAEWEQKFMAQP
ncbi:serine/threonine-protein kinase [Hyalangium sp.]|uniref:serine/threonine-protein kinase n=1 Tax=Hyalangium sp. TaxID=2028555 RepID=UPI002D2E82DF|nr:serine/threonine-protein kinase [Hyalangium sp.]HYI00429.1 serine/threonine-protein kinase [Hyalangium sp.]